MLLTYLDESMSKERYSIAALAVPDTEAKALTDALDKLVGHFAKSNPGMSPRAELHGHPLAQGKADWQPVAQALRLRLGLYRDAIETIARFDVAVFIRAVDVPLLNQRYVNPFHPHSVCLSHVIERVDEYATGLGQYALLIADEVDGQDEHRRDLGEYQNYGTVGYRSRLITRVVDTLHFVPSHNSRLVQAADLISYMAHRIATSNNPKTKDAQNHIWKPIEPRVHYNMCWRP